MKAKSNSKGETTQAVFCIFLREKPTVFGLEVQHRELILSAVLVQPRVNPHGNASRFRTLCSVAVGAMALNCHCKPPKHVLHSQVEGIIEDTKPDPF